MTTVAGSVGDAGHSGDGAPATSAKINSPRGVTVDSKGNLYISDTGNNLVRKVDTNGNISTFAGHIGGTNPLDGGPATNASLNFPYQLAVDASDNLYIADYGNHFRKVDIGQVLFRIRLIDKHSLLNLIEIFILLGIRYFNREPA